MLSITPKVEAMKYVHGWCLTQLTLRPSVALAPASAQVALASDCSSCLIIIVIIIGAAQAARLRIHSDLTALAVLQGRGFDVATLPNDLYI